MIKITFFFSFFLTTLSPLLRFEKNKKIKNSQGVIYRKPQNNIVVHNYISRGATTVLSVQYTSTHVHSTHAQYFSDKRPYNTHIIYISNINTIIIILNCFVQNEIGIPLLGILVRYRPQSPAGFTGLGVLGVYFRRDRKKKKTERKSHR